MPTFIVEETVPSFVTWRAEVEAESESEAIRKFLEGEYGGEEGPFFGDAIDSVPISRSAKIKEKQPSDSGKSQE